MSDMKDKFDIERFERIREISAEIVAHMADIPLEKVKNLFCNEVGYQTPKIDTRAVIFENNKILLIQESDGKWALPGGWADVYLSVKENVLKEVKEEAGISSKNTEHIKNPKIEELDIRKFSNRYKTNAIDYALSNNIPVEYFLNEVLPNNIELRKQLKRQR